MSDEAIMGQETSGARSLASAFPRHEQTFPTLTAQEIARMRRFGEDRNYHARRSAVRNRQARARHVRRAVRPCRDHPARRPRPCHAGHRSGTGAVSRRDRPAFRPRRAGRRPCRRRCRDAADSAGPAARAAGRGSRSRRAHHARADPAPRQSDPGRRRRAGADRPVEFARRAFACRVFSPATAIRIICSIRHADHGRCRTDCALFAVAGRPAAGGVPDGTVLRNPSETELARAMGMVARRRKGQGLRRRRRRLRPRGPGDRGLCGVRRACRSPCCDARVVRRPGRRQRPHRELSRLSDRHFRAGAGGARLQPGAEIRRRDHDPGRGQVARLLARRRRVRL